jgi:hypothetical protein
MLTPQQPDRIIEIGVEESMMLDHGADRGISEQRSAEASEPKAAAAAPVRQIERHGRVEQ